MSCGTENIKVEPMDVYIGSDVAQVQTITCVADVASSLQSKYFLLYDVADATRHLVWINVATLGVDPAIAGYTSHPVAISAGATAATIATAISAVTTVITGFDSTVSGGVITLTNTAVGAASFAHDSQAAKTGFAFSVTTVGDTFAKIGLIDGDIDVKGLSRKPVEITAHQKGATVLGQIFTSSGNPELSFTMKEVTYANYNKILRYAGGMFTPVAAASTIAIGGGTKGLFASPQYARVVLHPVRLGVADKTNDYCFWKCTLDLESIKFSGQNVLTLPVTVKSFTDCDTQDAVSTWMYGNWSQTFTA